MVSKKKKSKKRNDGRYEIKRKIVDENGEIKTKSFYSKIGKDDCIQKYLEYLQKSNSIKSKTVTLDVWAERWLETYKEGKVKESTFKWTYQKITENIIIPYFPNADIKNIKPSEIQSFLNAQSLVYSNSTMKKIMLCLNAIFDTAIDNDICKKNPAKKISVQSKKQSKTKRTYAEEERDIILKYSDYHEYGIYIRILLELGLRASELCGLKWQDINWQDKTVTIQRACTNVNGRAFIDRPKSKTSIRSLPLSSELYDRLIVYRKQINISESINSYLVYLDKHSWLIPISPSKFSKTLYKKFFDDFLKNNPNIESLTPHELRHTCGTLLYASSKDIYAVSKYLGHSNVNITTKFYVHDDVDILREHLNIK